MKVHKQATMSVSLCHFAQFVKTCFLTIPVPISAISFAMVALMLSSTYSTVSVVSRTVRGSGNLMPSLILIAISFTSAFVEDLSNTGLIGLLLHLEFLERSTVRPNFIMYTRTFPQHYGDLQSLSAPVAILELEQTGVKSRKNAMKTVAGFPVHDISKDLNTTTALSSC